jgi:beta-N-acetylhexosaminidase
VTDLARAAARLLTVGFAGKSVDGEMTRLLEAGVGGAVLFSRNVGAPREVAELTAELKRRATVPLLVAVDQEGGSVARLRAGFTPLPPLRALGDAGDPELARAVGRVVGAELRSVGVDWNFAPVLDVDTNPDNPVIGRRSLGRDPLCVAELGIAFARGLMDAGVAPCGKHFPGHGDTHQDSHHELPRLPHPLERLERVELVPFARAVAAGLPALMTAHIVFEAIDSEQPASLSPRVIGELLRGRLGFGGVVVTDDLDMKAIADHFPIEDVAVRALQAGVDALLVCLTPALAWRAIDAIVRAVQSGELSEKILTSATSRLDAFAARFARPAETAPDLGSLGSDAHRAVLERLREHAGA